MRWSFFTTLILVLLFGVALSAPAADIAERNVDANTTVDERAQPDATTTPTRKTSSQTSIATTTSTGSAETTATNTATPASTTTNDTTSSNTSHATVVTTTVPSLDGSTASDSSSQYTTKQRYTGGLPIQPQITPAWGVGGIILLLLGAAQAFVGIRKQW